MIKVLDTSHRHELLSEFELLHAETINFWRRRTSLQNESYRHPAIKAELHKYAIEKLAISLLSLKEYAEKHATELEKEAFVVGPVDNLHRQL